MSVAWAVFRAGRVSKPRPTGGVVVDHGDLATVLQTLETEGVSGLAPHQELLRAYRDNVASFAPDDMSRQEALAYWLNLYNAGAVHLAAEAAARGERSVLRVPGAFTRTWAHVGGEALSLSDIEHGKIRRFGDPRIHGALVCGSTSCPNLRYEPFSGARLDDQLDGQLRGFLRAGGVSRATDAGELRLSRVFLWYGSDFTRPRRMPTRLPARGVRRWCGPWDSGWIPTSGHGWRPRSHGWRSGRTTGSWAAR